MATLPLQSPELRFILFFAAVRQILSRRHLEGLDQTDHFGERDGIDLGFSGCKVGCEVSGGGDSGRK
ncbi:hypothetical protein RHGRI_000010 [Rhododendron griersonianum]|uniref:Uncharacterized protein n=1 Tax=Rhododendron griersonianum TaxID=479676 RepID=A0AAV6LHP3_9ERIC|nr:hypothetical protein RHGRI_000010 [Rhododendron griersonianum]